jgi:hypothetical protein
MALSVSGAFLESSFEPQEISPMIFPNDENGDVLRLMESNGDDLTQPRNVDFEHIFDSLADALEFMRDAANHTDALTLSWYDGEKKWNVCVMRHMVPTHPAISDLEASLDKIAHAHGGNADGWGCMQVDASGS